MRLNTLYLLLLLTFFTPTLNANFFSDLFGTDSEQIVEEEVIELDEDKQIYEEKIIDFTNESTKAFDDEEINVDQDWEDTQNVRSKSIFLSYIDKPKKIYLSQHVSIKVKAIIADERFDNINTTFTNKKDVHILNKDSSWKKISDNTYENSYIYKLFSTVAKMPNIKITTYLEGTKYQSEILRSYKPNIIALREDKEFCQVLSNDFTLISHNEKKYDEKSNIIVMEMSAKDANLEDFHIPFSLRDGIDRISTNKNTQSIYYFAIVSNNIKKFKFKYFDLMSNKYNIVSFPVKLIDSSISTQTDLNPHKNRYILYKAIALFVLSLIMFLFFLKTKKLYLLLFSLILFTYVIYLQIPVSKATLQSGVKLRILPTENSTIFYEVQKKMTADILLKKDGYIKVILANKKIGWIKRK